MNDKVDPGRYNNEQAFENNNETDDPLLYASQDKDIDKMGMSHLEPESTVSHSEPEEGLSHLEPEGGLPGFDPEMHVMASDVAEAISHDTADDHAMHEAEPRLNAFEDPVLPTAEVEPKESSAMLIVGAAVVMAAVIWLVWPAADSTVGSGAQSVLIEGQETHQPQ